MLTFTPQQVAENTIIDQIILETALCDQTISVNQFKGAVVVDPNLGNYVVIDFTVTDTAAMNIGRIQLMSGQTTVAISDDKQLNIVKEAGKNLKIRLAAQFVGAEKCKFNTTSVNLPYATPFREGVVRFNNGEEANKSGTVYSAKDVDDKISAVTGSLGNLKDYAKINAENTFAENNVFSKNVTVNGEIGGNAVATKDLANEKDTLVVSLGFANDKYLSKLEAGNTYLTQTDASTTYLTKTEATTAAGNYAKLDGGNTFTGDVNTFKEVNATKFSGDGVTGAITPNATPNNPLIPTDVAVKTYVDGKVEALNGNVTALQDNDLQSQIDGINAGQNLADIVNNTTELAAYDVSHLKAKDDFQHGSTGAKWAIGDKVQVLGGGDTDAQSCVYELIKGTKPEDETNSIQSTNNAAYYWHYIGVYGTNAYTKAEIDSKLGTVNNTLDAKADKSYVDTELADKANSADVYTKNESDIRFAQLAADNTFTGNNTFNGIIMGDAVTSDIATDAANQGVKLTTSNGVSNFVTKVVDDRITELQGGMSYLQLSSAEKQTVTSSVDFNGTIGGSAVTDTQMAEDAIPNSTAKLVNLGFAENRYAKLGDDNEFLGKNNTFQTIAAQAFKGDGVATNEINPDGKKLPTEHAVSQFVTNAITENQDATSDKTKVGAMGLFLYTGGDLKVMGEYVLGTSLQAVGMQLPMDGVVSWSQGETMPYGSTWKLLNNTIAGEPCLVLAIRTA